MCKKKKVSVQSVPAAWRVRVRFFCLHSHRVRGHTLVGPPTAFLRRRPGVPWVSLLGPTSVPSDAEARWHREQSARPLWLLVLLRGRSRGRGVLVHFALRCVLEYLHPCSMVCAGTSLPSFVFPRRVQWGLRERQLLEIRVALRHCTRPVPPDKSRSRASSSQWDPCSTPGFLFHAIRILVLPRDSSQHSLAFVKTCPWAFFSVRMFLAVSFDSLQDFLCACRFRHSHRVSFVFTSNACSVLGLELRLVLLDFATVSDCIHQLVLVDWFVDLSPDALNFLFASFLVAFKELFLHVCRCENCFVWSCRLVLVDDRAPFAPGSGSSSWPAAELFWILVHIV